MATKCNNDCPPCQEAKAAVYICLKSEPEFLASLLRLGMNAQGEQNLLGYKPVELIDWYLYAKRAFSSWPTSDLFGWSIKLLDELGKIVFGIAQVTARAPSDYPQERRRGKLLMLQPLEQQLIETILKTAPPPGDDVCFPVGLEYAKLAQKASKLCDDAERQLTNGENIAPWRSDYIGKLECRIAYTDICEIGRFCWQEQGVDVILIRSGSPQTNRDVAFQHARTKLACVFLHGVAKFALSHTPSGESDGDPTTGAQGYWIHAWDVDTPEAPQTPLSAVNERTLAPSPSFAEEKGEVFGLAPMPRSRVVRLSCELAASLVKDYYVAFKNEGVRLFDILFMCKEKTGWFWVFTDSQLKYLDKIWEKKTSRYRSALESFRFGKAGIINHLERTECLIEEVHDFNLERFICVAAGYRLEEASDSDAFRDLENLLPEVRNSSYSYFRLSAHGTKSGEKILPEGALVAVVRFDRDHLSAASINTRLEKMARVRKLIERWRAKVDSIRTIDQVVRELARPAHEKTARAAIMSRNLSHNVGSHALANSRFFEAVGLLNAQERSPGEDEGFETLSFPHPKPLRQPSPPGAVESFCPVCLNKVPPKGPISRSDDGSVQFEEKIVGDKPTGKPLMANRPVLKGEAWRARNRLGAMNSYLQGRMDFIARALGDSSSQPEPMFFINDLLKGFLSQSVLLNTLLSDNGYTADHLDFIVTLGSVIITFNGTAKDHQIRHADFIERGKCHDVLVAIPGGMVGRHAFYAFLENFMRNAAKYGAHSRTRAGIAGKERFEIHLDLREIRKRQGAVSSSDGVTTDRQTDSCYALTIRDNLSADPDGAAVDRVRLFLNETIIDEKDKPRTEGHGIQEMKVCAQFLAGGETDALVFPKDQELTDDGGCLGAAYKAYSETARTKITEKNSLICHPHPLGESFNLGDKALAYSILFQQPRLLGIVQYGVFAECPARAADKEPTVVFYDSITGLSEKPAYFGLVKIDSSQVVPALEEIAKCHTALPYRLMLVVDGKDANKVTDLRKEVAQWQNERSAAWYQKRQDGTSTEYFPLPTRRVHVIECGDLFRMTGQSESAQLRNLTIRIYDKWLEAFKGAELQGRTSSVDTNSVPSAPKWNLAIGFQRTMKAVLSKWNLGGNDAINLGFDPQSTQISLYLFFNPENTGNGEVNCASNESLGKVKFEGESSLRATLLALDNHGQCIANEDTKGRGETGSIPVYHAFSGSQQVDLFQLLDSPPTDQFSRSFLVYSVAEALLTKVVIVDERVAEACIEEASGKPKAFGVKLREKQRAGIFPLYSITTRKEGPRHLLLEAARVAVENVWSNKPEGLYLAGTSSVEPAMPEIRSATLDSNGQPREVLMSSINELPDFIVIHEGVTDSLKSKNHWIKGDHQSLYAICPAVVRTSGRGSISRDLGEELPFYEFSELSDFTYRQMNKVALARGLLALRGNLQKKQ
jgi:hypothetical protein